jgi:hypothetical protein
VWWKCGCKNKKQCDAIIANGFSALNKTSKNYRLIAKKSETTQPLQKTSQNCPVDWNRINIFKDREGKISNEKVKSVEQK